VDYYSDMVPHEARLCLLPCCVEESRMTCVAGLAACTRHLVRIAAPDLLVSSHGIAVILLTPCRDLEIFV